MNDPSPYQPPLSQNPPPIQYVAAGDPPAVKVLGILHLIFAGLGVIGALWGLFIAMMGNPFLKMGSHSPQIDMQIVLQAKLQPVTITLAILSLIVGGIMITAGFLMLKKRNAGLKWSNAYAYSSLTAKLVNLVLNFTIMIPAMHEMTRGIMGNTKQPAAFSTIMSGSIVVGAIGGVLVSCIYPVLSLVLLNRPATKEWFARLPK